MLLAPIGYPGCHTWHLASFWPIVVFCYLNFKVKKLFDQSKYSMSETVPAALPHSLGRLRGAIKNAHQPNRLGAVRSLATTFNLIACCVWGHRVMLQTLYHALLRIKAPSTWTELARKQRTGTQKKFRRANVSRDHGEISKQKQTLKPILKGNEI